MQLGTYVLDGRPLSYDETTGKFDVGGMTVTLNAIAAWDASNQVEWDRPDLRSWVLSLPRTPVVTPAPQPVKKKSNAVVIIAVVAVLLTLCLCGVVVSSMPSTSTPSSPGSSNPGASSPAPAEKPNEDLSVTDTKMVAGQYGVRTITGTVVNNTNRSYGYVQVEINLYDASGAQVGSTLANVNNLAPGGTWKFTAGVLEDSATSFQIKGITKW